jgi:hypothetical protein
MLGIEVPAIPTNGMRRTGCLYSLTDPAAATCSRSSNSEPSSLAVIERSLSRWSELGFTVVKTHCYHHVDAWAALVFRNVGPDTQHSLFLYTQPQNKTNLIHMQQPFLEKEKKGIHLAGTLGPCGVGV